MDQLKHSVKFGLAHSVDSEEADKPMEGRLQNNKTRNEEVKTIDDHSENEVVTEEKANRLGNKTKIVL